MGATRRTRRGAGDEIDETVVSWRKWEGFSLRLHCGEEGPPAPFARARFHYALAKQGSGTLITGELHYSLR